MLKPEKIILASASPRRRELLSAEGVVFEIHVADVKEFEDPLADPLALVHYNAQLKAKTIAAKFPNALVIGSDTTVFHKQEILNKPVDMEDAYRMIRRLSGTSHQVYTGLSLIHKMGEIDEIHADSSYVTFKKLNDEQIKEYFSIVNPLDKAGAYGIQEGRDIIIDKYEGSLSNIMGLPMELLMKRLKALGVV